MTRAGRTLAAAIALVSVAGTAPATVSSCEMCTDASTGPTLFEREERPLKIEIESGIRFGRLALRGPRDGGATIDPQTGERRTDANTLDLGGATFQGRAKITGEPMRPVRIEMPTRVRLRSPDGAEASLSEFVTNLPAVPMLDANGELEFAFGARISSKQARGGAFRGSIRIRVDYF